MLHVRRRQHRLLVPAVVACLTTGAMSANARAAGTAPLRGDCADRVDELERRYRQVEAEADGARFLPFSTAFEAPTLLDGPPPEQLTAVLQLYQAGAIFNGRPLEDDAKEPKKLMTAIERELTKSTETWRILHPGKKVPRVSFGLWIDRRVAALDAAGLLMALSSKYETGVFGMGTRDVTGARRRALSASARSGCRRSTTRPRCPPNRSSSPPPCAMPSAVARYKRGRSRQTTPARGTWTARNNIFTTLSSRHSRGVRAPVSIWTYWKE